ncbi:NRDE protein-domain-containing protein [Scheffersomyces amazonensis]|uniref:NRDE protein-domain-containing protein n=1 Tax=Scheffersomyces amazonensis TaxID=1078765 RepID=UPI00315C6A25
MCILVATTKHPDYPLILLSNRDEYFKRPTRPAHFRPLDSSSKILSPADLGRSENGTWIGITTTGKIAVLLNYREDDNKNSFSEISRGILPLEYLCGKSSDDDWFHHIKLPNEGKIDLSRIGGFSLVFGKLNIDPGTTKIDHLNIISNRGDHGKILGTNQVHGEPCNDLHDDIYSKKTFGISNSLYYNPWRKVKLGEDMVDELMERTTTESLSKHELIEECFKILSTDTYNREIYQCNDFDIKFKELRNSIFIPPLDTGKPEQDSSKTVGRYYGTRTQTVIILDKHGTIDYFERNLHNSDDIETDRSFNQHFSFKVPQPSRY